MRTFALSPEPARTALLLALFLALLLLLGLLFLAYTHKAKRAQRAVNAVLFFAFFLLLLLLCTVHNAIEEGMLLIFRSAIPMWGLWCATIALLLYAVCGIAMERRRSANTIDRNAIKEALDTLPIGVCYFTEQGLVKMCNLQMYRLFYAFSQSDLQSHEELQNARKGCDARTGIIRLSGEEDVYLFPNGKAWLYDEAQLQLADGSSCTEAIFYDVTELYEKRLEIETQTKKLRELGRNIRALCENVVAATKEEEMLSFKTTLHDRMGAGLVAARQVLLQNRPLEELDASIHAWRQSVSLVKQDNRTLTDRGELPELIRDANAIGVTLCIEGELPAPGDAYDVFLNAIRECLTNCVMHADGTALYVALSADAGADHISVTNDGNPPREEIVPRGGLSNLLKRVGYLGGTMQIRSAPTFMLRVTIPKKRGIPE